MELLKVQTRLFMIVCLTFFSNISVAVIYEFRNAPTYEEFHAPYDGSMSVSGYIELEELATPNHYILSTELVTYSFTDGVETFDDTNSAFRVFTNSTDENANIVEYWIILYKAPLGTVVGDSINVLGLKYSSQIDELTGDVVEFVDYHGHDATTTTINPINWGGQFGDGNGRYHEHRVPQVTNKGEWILRGNPTQVPTNNPWFLVVLVLMFGLVSFKVLK